HEQRFAMNVGKTHVEIAGQPLFGMAVKTHILQVIHDALAELFTQLGLSLCLSISLLTAQLARRAEADDERDRQRAAAQAALMAAAVEDRFQPNVRIAPADVERANAFRTINLVRG